MISDATTTRWSTGSESSRGRSTAAAAAPMPKQAEQQSVAAGAQAEAIAHDGRQQRLDGGSWPHERDGPHEHGPQGR